MLIAVLVIILTILVLYVYVKLIRTLTFWKDQNIPSAIPVPVFGNIKDFVLGKRHLIYIYNDFYRNFDKQQFFGIYELRSPNLLIRDVKLANRILVKDFSSFYDRGMHVDEDLDPLNAHLVNLCGSRWKSTRAKLMPAFSSGKLRQMFGLIENCVNELEDHIRPFVESGKPVEIREVMTKFATDVIGRCALGLECKTLTDPNSEFRTIGQRIFKFTFKLMVRICLRLLNPKLLKLVPVKAIPFEIERFFFNLLDDAMAHRKAQAERRVDFLQLMIDIKEQEKKTDANGGVEHLFSDTLLVANMFVFFAAGFETTANTLSFCLYELALNPHVQTKLREEIQNALESQELNYDVVTNLSYLDMVISETLRKYAPIPIINRICTKEYQIPGTNTILKANTRITVPIHSYHYDEQYFPNADQFLPERFENLDKPLLGYLPFGNGPRICIGLKLAKLEIKRCLASIISKYSFSPCAKTEIPLQIKARAIFLTPENGVQLSIKKIDVTK